MSLKQLNIRGTDWEYLSAGEGGAKTILLFHGAVGGAQNMGWLADALSPTYRILAPTVAPVQTLDEVCDATSAILDREHVGRATVFGGSFGGLIAQAFLKRRRRQVEDLILLSTGAPSPPVGTRTAKMQKVVDWLPFWLTRGLMKAELLRHLKAPAGMDHEARQRFSSFRERLDDYMNHKLTKAEFASRLQLSIEFNCVESYSPDDFADFTGRVLIVDSENDPMISPEERARLHSLYPAALVCTFENAGHLIPLLHMDELIGVMNAFIENQFERPDVGCQIPDVSGRQT